MIRCLFAVLLCLAMTSGAEAWTIGTLPQDAQPQIGVNDDVILCVHGGPSSRLEECSDLIGPLFAAATAAGKSFTIIGFDQADQGYSSMIDPINILPQHQNGVDYYPAVAFGDSVINAFIDQLDVLTHIKRHRIFVIGGSTGGALALRTGRPKQFSGDTDFSWVTKIVAWNPASVWTTYTHDALKGTVLDQGFQKAGPDPGNQPEDSSERKSYFDDVFGEPSLTLGVQPNPEEWYRGDRGAYPSNGDTQKPFRSRWSCKMDYIAAARVEQQEVYNSSFRLWHWRLGTELLAFSFFNDNWLGPANSAGDDTRGLFQTIQKPALLIASDDDDWNEGPGWTLTIALVPPLPGWHWENRWTRTRLMATNMTAVPRQVLSLPNTGHSVHNERPNLLAQTIVSFVSGTGLTPFSGALTPVTPPASLPDDESPPCRKQLPFLVPSSELLADPHSADSMNEEAQQGGNLSNGLSPGNMSLRLSDDLRTVAKQHEPLVALARATEHFFRGDAGVANAFADLAVTGRAAYDSFAQSEPLEASVKFLARFFIDEDTNLTNVDETVLDNAYKTARARAYEVAWALRSPNGVERVQMRSQLHWIAVSGEDDPPARPVNVPSGWPIFDSNGTQISTWPQFELPVGFCRSDTAPFVPIPKNQCDPKKNLPPFTMQIRYTIAVQPHFKKMKP